MTKIEEVARAIYAARARHFGESPRDPPVRDERWELCISYARAAIEAMRSPTAPMIEGARGIPITTAEAGHAFIEDCDSCGPLWMRDFWNAMIDAALAEKT